MNKKTLVTFASRTGSTAEIAEAIYKTLVQCGEEAELLPMTNVKDLSSYHAVMLGSSIRKSQWLPEAMQFLQEHRGTLANKRVAIFTVCITLAMPKAEQYLPAVKNWIAPVRAQVQSLSEGFFAGKLDLSKLPWTLDTLLFRATVALGILPKGDHRDWNAVRSWAQALHPTFWQ
jgi:menaquinone-dependent protoporphyrinogen oxidase